MPEARLATMIITSYNYGRFLRQTIDSALQQTYPDTEVIVVDDGSTDESLEIIATYSGQIAAVSKDNGGQASAFNVGFGLSRGDTILFLDSDDILLPTAVERSLMLFDGPNVAKVHWPLWEVDADGRKTGALHPPQPLGEGDYRDEVIQHGPCRYTWPSTSGNAWARWFLERVLPIPESDYVTCADYYLAELAAIFGSIRRVTDPQGLYRIHGQNNLGRLLYDEKARRFRHLCDAVSAFLREDGVEVDPEAWKKPNREWIDRVDGARRDLTPLIRPGDRFILVDEDQFRYEFPAGRQAIPFLERQGRYWGPPPDDDTAVRELERLRQAGASLIAFAWPAFWWLDHYSGLHRHLRSAYRCILDNDRLTVFDLRP